MTVEKMGPRPSRTDERGSALTPQRALVLDELRHKGLLTVSELAATTGLHENTIREHLDGLAEVHLIGREQAPASGRGRPAWRYSARPVQQSTRTRDYAGLATALAAQIAGTSAAPAADALAAGERWGRSLVADLPAEPTRQAARHRVTALLTELGFSPTADGQHRWLRLERCPLLDAARQYPDVVCAVHAGLVRSALISLGAAPDHDQVDLRPFAEPGACLLRLGNLEAEETTEETTDR